MIVVATTEAELDRVRARLDESGLVIMDVVAPAEHRRVVVAAGSSEPDESIAVALRAEGELAVTRPAAGAALAAWHRDTEPVVIAERVSICMAWAEHDRHGLPGIVELGPGGFGSGHHPTTRLLVEVLAARLGGGERVLDVGCGTGVLGLSALVLGAGDVVGLDLKPEAVAATERNAVLNGLGGQMAVSGASPADLSATFDTVVANIARAGIVALATELVARVAPAGWLAVSGITAGQCDQVAGYLAPLAEVERRESSGWAALVLAR